MYKNVFKNIYRKLTNIPKNVLTVLMFPHFYLAIISLIIPFLDFLFFFILLQAYSFFCGTPMTSYTGTQDHNQKNCS